MSKIRIFMQLFTDFFDKEFATVVSNREREWYYIIFNTVLHGLYQRLDIDDICNKKVVKTFIFNWFEEIVRYGLASRRVLSFPPSSIHCWALPPPRRASSSSSMCRWGNETPSPILPRKQKHTVERLFKKSTKKLKICCDRKSVLDNRLRHFLRGWIWGRRGLSCGLRCWGSFHWIVVSSRRGSYKSRVDRLACFIRQTIAQTENRKPINTRTK